MKELGTQPWFLQVGYFFRFAKDQQTRYFPEGDPIQIPVEGMTPPVFLVLSQGCLYFYKGSLRTRADLEEIDAVDLTPAFSHHEEK